jgi:hypothetical protein
MLVRPLLPYSGIGAAQCRYFRLARPRDNVDKRKVGRGGPTGGFHGPDSKARRRKV